MRPIALFNSLLFNPRQTPRFAMSFKASVRLGALLLLLTALSFQAEAANTTKHKKAPNKPAAMAAKAKKKPVTPIYESYAARPAAMGQVEAIASKTQLDPAWVRQVLGQARHVPAITQLVLPPAVGVPKNWRAYRERFVEPVRINAGLLFWQAHAKTLARAEATYGVPAKYIVSIIGIESLYGRNTGNFKVIDALATLAFDFPAEHPRAAARQAFFRDELEQFLVMSHRNATNPLNAKGSYAGAIGLPQFMPSSINRYAVDFDGDGKVDLFNSADDVIGSVAHYFQAFKWQPGAPTHFAIQMDPAKLDLPGLLAPDILPTFDQATLLEKGVELTPQGTVYNGKLALVELQNGSDPPSYVAGTDNFYTITRYNWSSYYAMAVIELGDAVAREMQP